MTTTTTPPRNVTDSTDDSSDDSSTDDSSDDSSDDGAMTDGEGMLVESGLPYPYQFPEPGGLTPKAGGSLNVAATFSISTLDPTASAAGGTITVPNMTYNRLLGMVGGVNKNPFALELEPELAASWERSPDGTTFTFNLRDDINWQNVDPLNGRPFVAEDVKYAYERYQTEGVHQSYWANIGAIEAVDDHTLKITMSNVTADFVAPLASRYQTIFPRELVDDGTIDQRAIGTGPMILTDIETGNFATFEKNPDYWEREVLIDGAHFQIVSDPAARIAGLRVGQYDYAYGTPGNKTELDALIGTNPDMQVNLSPVTYGQAFGMNLSNPLFADERIRRAMTLAIDTDLMEAVIYDGWAKTLPLQPWTFIFDEEPTLESGILGNWWRYDPDEAKKLLQAAGAEDLAFDSIYYNYSIAYDQQTEIVIDNFKDVGIDINSQRGGLHAVQLDVGARQPGDGDDLRLADGWLRRGQLVLQPGPLAVAGRPLVAERPAGRPVGRGAAGRAGPRGAQGKAAHHVGLLPRPDVLPADALGLHHPGLPAVAARGSLRRRPRHEQLLLRLGRPARGCLARQVAAGARWRASQELRGRPPGRPRRVRETSYAARRSPPRSGVITRRFRI